MPYKKILRRTAWSVLILFVLVNLFAGFHAYKFTHFSDTKAPRTDPRKLSVTGKLKTIFFGVDNPRPVTRRKPDRPYQTIHLQSNYRIECWLLKTPEGRGTVALFHGYSGEKSSLLEKAYAFTEMGYNAVLVDFMGSGGSGGNHTTIGYKESQDVKTVYDYLSAQGEKNIYLFGSSLGAAAVLKALHDDALRPRGIIIECPFATLYDATCARFRAVGVPGFPLAGFVVFWGGVENGFWGFSHRPVRYAEDVKVPALMFYGEKDERVPRPEIDAIYAALAGSKKLVTFPEAGHSNYFAKYRYEWVTASRRFLLEH
ncbi:alpha/beta hydrolase [Chitinophaga lutea]|uniref:Alpha/beta hydrolase n=1 Tax=Chitinophaga lutea TaxID=2488634 RepID=A0A3N4QMK8_9BACT|nr:alpha/beta fold hydrolase [Chitinophaga lutea]RPE12944.1 alpha/beta hydrolase [Chitinophaga lutea]